MLIFIILLKEIFFKGPVTISAILPMKEELIYLSFLFNPLTAHNQL